jgi:malate dehydrogenase (oxaloacetate-decarboxylating)
MMWLSLMRARRWPYAEEGVGTMSEPELVDLPVLTVQDTTAITLTAEVLTTLTRLGRPPRTSRVMIVGADTLPILCPLLMVSGVGDIATWRQADARAFPLHRVAADVHLVVDLLGVWPRAAGPAPRPGPAVVKPGGERDTRLVRPGLLRALTQVPDARMDIEVHHACVLALVMATPPDQRLPRCPRRDLADRVAAAATLALHQGARHHQDARAHHPHPHSS